MVYVISGTNRHGSYTLQIAHLIQSEFQKNKEPVELISLEDLPMSTLHDVDYWGKNIHPQIFEVLQKLNKSDAIFIVTPEYNGSYPGILKYFIDHFSYPETFEYRPIAFVGLGGRWGGVRPVEHLQQVFNYRNAFIFPERVFIRNIETALENGKLKDTLTANLISRQVKNFIRYCQALRAFDLDANSVRKQEKTSQTL